MTGTDERSGHLQGSSALFSRGFGRCGCNLVFRWPKRGGRFVGRWLRHVPKRRLWADFLVSAGALWPVLGIEPVFRLLLPAARAVPIHPMGQELTRESPKIRPQTPFWHAARTSSRIALQCASVLSGRRRLCASKALSCPARRDLGFSRRPAGSLSQHLVPLPVLQVRPVMPLYRRPALLPAALRPADSAPVPFLRKSGVSGFPVVNQLPYGARISHPRRPWARTASTPDASRPGRTGGAP